MATLLCLTGLGLFGHFHGIGSDLVAQLHDVLLIFSSRLIPCFLQTWRPLRRSAELTAEAFARDNSSLARYVLTGMVTSSLSRNARPVTTAKTMFIGIMMPLKASIGMETSVPTK